MKKSYKCFKCGYKSEEEDDFIRIPTRGRKRYYLCSECDREGEYNLDADPKYEKVEDVA